MSRRGDDWGDDDDRYHEDAAEDAPARPPLMHERIKEATDLAVAYAQDGAYHSALRHLRRATKLAADHVKWLKANGL